MVDPNLEDVPNYAGAEFDLIRAGLRAGYVENDEQVIERLVAAWQANRALRINAWNARREAEARLAEEAKQEHCWLAEEEERAAIAEAEREQNEADKKKPKMNSFTPGSSVADVLVHPPSQYAIQKLNSGTSPSKAASMQPNTPADPTQMTPSVFPKSTTSSQSVPSPPQEPPAMPYKTINSPSRTFLAPRMSFLNMPRRLSGRPKTSTP